MIHLWRITNSLDLELNIEELLKYPILADIYKKDNSDGKFLSTEYFKYLDFITNPKGYCVSKGLNSQEADIYAKGQTRLPKDYYFPKNNKLIIKYVKDELQFDVIDNLVGTAIKALNVTSKSLANYIDRLNDLEEKDYMDDKGAPIDLSSIITKMMKIAADIPNNIKQYESLLEKQTTKKTIVRGSIEYTESMDGDESLEHYSTDEE